MQSYSETFANLSILHSFSRKILWLHLSPTNRNPHVVANFYAQCVKKVGGKLNFLLIQVSNCSSYNPTGCPYIVRCDRGTENCVLAASQMALRHDHGDRFSGEKAFKYGKSTSNTVSTVRYLSAILIESMYCLLHTEN